MKRHIAVLTLIFTVLLIGCGPDRPDLQIVTVPAPSLSDNLIGTSIEQQVAVYLPPMYNMDERRYPVVYFLPGYSTPIEAFVYGSFQGFELKASLDSLIRNGIIHEMILVIPNGSTPFGGSFYVNSPVSGGWENYITRDLVAYVDSTYRTIASPGSRGIAGHSMGGYGALNLAMLHPDVYGSVYSISPGLFDEDGLRNCQMFATEQVRTQTQELINELRQLSVEDAHTHFLSQISTIRELDEWDLLFTITYGIAFSPDPSHAPYFRYPITRDMGMRMEDEIVWAAWERGFGGVNAEIYEYWENFAGLNAMALDYGANDSYRWIPEGCDYFVEKMNEADLPLLVYRHDGGHSDHLRERIEQHMLPFFNEFLSFVE